MVLSIYCLCFFSSSEFFQIKKMRSFKQLAETNVVKMKNSSTGTVRRIKKKTYLAMNFRWAVTSLFGNVFNHLLTFARKRISNMIFQSVCWVCILFVFDYRERQTHVLILFWRASREEEKEEKKPTQKKVVCYYWQTTGNGSVM